METFQEIIEINFSSLEQLEKKWDEINKKSVDNLTYFVNNLMKKQYFLIEENWGIFKNNEFIQKKV